MTITTAASAAAKPNAINDQLYGYSSRQVEPVVHIIKPEEDWIVRISYGALIWMSTSTMILDIDDEEPNRGFYGAVSIYNVLSQLGWKFRTYKTCNGYRVVIPDLNADRSSQEGSPFWDAGQSLPVDVNYKQLCHKQRCFRARPSTKPWRTGEIRYVPSNPIADSGIAIDPKIGITRLIHSSYIIPEEGSELLEAIRLHDWMTGGTDHYVDGVELA